MFSGAGRISSSSVPGLAWLFLIWAATFLSHQQSGYYASDELYYASARVDSFFLTRSGWIFLNGLISQFSSDTILWMRILNLGFLFLFFGSLVKSCKTIPPMLHAIFVSYVACIAALNLRDVAIYFFFSILLSKMQQAVNSVRGIGKIAYDNVWPFLCMLTLRPIQAMLVLLSVLRLHVIVLVVTAGLLFLQTDLGTRYFYNYAYFTQNFTEATQAKAERLMLSDGVPSLANVGFWTARFVFAPSPWSSLERLIVSPDSYEYGEVDLFIRTLSRASLYVLFIMILFRFAKSPKRAFEAIRSNSYLINFFMLFSLLYAVFNFGGSHERLKVNLLILTIFLLDRINQNLAANKGSD